MKWEYSVYSCDVANLQDVLDLSGENGWELVETVVTEMPLHSGGRSIALIFKRPKP